MPFAKLLRRLLPGKRPSPDSERARYAAAADLENSTQSHYRNITGSDSQGRSTKADREPGSRGR